MKKNKTDMSSILNKLSTQERDWIKYGSTQYGILKEVLTEALVTNQFGDHYYIYSEPGYSKTFTTQQICKERKINPLPVYGNLGLFAFAANLAYLLQTIKGEEKIKVIFDDCDTFFEKANINVVKGMYDKARNCLAWNKSLTAAVLSTLDEEQAEALQMYRTVGRSGFEIPTDRFTFITLTNKPLASADDIDKASDTRKQTKRDEYAVRRRVQYKNLSNYESEVAWGYCAHILLTEPLIEKVIPNVSLEDKLEMLQWTSPTNKWSRVSDRNLSLFEKMAKDKVTNPKNYLDKWASSYLILR